MRSGTHGRQRSYLDSLELELQEVVYHRTHVLELGPLQEQASDFNFSHLFSLEFPVLKPFGSQLVVQMKKLTCGYFFLSCLNGLLTAMPFGLCHYTSMQ